MPVDRPVIGLVLAGLGMLSIAGMNSTAKVLIETYSPGQVTVLRFAVAWVLLMLVMVMTGRTTELAYARLGGHVLRGVLMTLTTLTFNVALIYLPIAETTVLAFSMPLFMVALSIPLLHERPRSDCWLFAAIGFVGVAILVQPGVLVINWGVPFALLSAVTGALMFIMMRRLQDTETTAAIMVHGTIFAAISAGLLFPFDWEVPARNHLWIFGVLGLFGALATYLMTNAFRFVGVSTAAPMHYLNLVGAVIFGYALWGHIPNVWVWVGSILIAGSGVLVLGRVGRSAV